MSSILLCINNLHLASSFTITLLTGNTFLSLADKNLPNSEYHANYCVYYELKKLTRDLN